MCVCGSFRLRHFQKRCGTSFHSPTQTSGFSVFFLFARFADGHEDDHRVIIVSDCSVWVHGSWAPICGQTTGTYLLMQFKQYLQIVLMNSRTRTRKLNSVRANTMAPMLALALPAMMRSAATPANVICVNFAKSIKAKMTATMARWAPTRAIVIVNSKISRTKAHERKSVG